MCMSKRRGPDSIMPRFRWMSNMPLPNIGAGCFHPDGVPAKVPFEGVLAPCAIFCLSIVKNWSD